MKTAVIAHRGASREAPENTLAAFNLAWDQGADAVELDVQETKDGRLVVLHDEDIRRTTGVRGLVGHQTFAALQQLDAGLWKLARWKGERIPLLSDVLATVPVGRRVYIEIKSGIRILPELERVLEACLLLPEQMVLMGFDYDLMRTIRQQFAVCETGWVIERPWKAPSLPRIIERATEAGFRSLHFSGEWPLDQMMIDELHHAGFMVTTWTVDEPRRALQLVAAGIDGIITNDPLRIRKAMEAHLT